VKATVFRQAPGKSRSREDWRKYPPKVAPPAKQILPNYFNMLVEK